LFLFLLAKLANMNENVCVQIEYFKDEIDIKVESLKNELEDLRLSLVNRLDDFKKEFEEYEMKLFCVK
jgi:hypothetical protein